jgi:drug/metabolite transporter superfamily protein YnfA
MKTLFRIIGILAIVISLVTCGMSIYRSGLDKEDLAEEQPQLVEAQKQLASLKEMAKTMTGESKVEMDKKVAEAEEAMASVPSASTYTIIQIFISAMLALALIFGVFLFRTNLKLSQQLLIASVVLLVVTYFISPDLKRGEYSGFASRTLALISGIPVIIAGLCAWMVARKSVAK